MPVWDKYVEIRGMVTPGIDFPEDCIEIDKDMIIKKASAGSCAVHLRVETKEGEELHFSQADKSAEERVLNFASLYTFFSGIAVGMSEAGAGTISADEPLGRFGGLTVTLRMEYGPEVKAKVTNKERRLVSSYVEYFKEHEKLLSIPYLRNALHYLYYSMRMHRTEDRLIHLMVSLESLFSRESQELSYRISLRATSLLTNMFDDRTPKDIVGDMKDLYDKRSAIVHGNQGVEVSVDDMQRLEAYVRRALKGFLHLAETMDRDDILQLLDGSLVDDAERERLKALVKSIM
jgi:hypothetical protein